MTPPRHAVACFALLLLAFVSAAFARQATAPPSADAHAHHQHAALTPAQVKLQERQLATQRHLLAMDERLDELVAAMDEAEGEDRERAMEALLTELMAQRQRLREMVREERVHAETAVLEAQLAQARAVAAAAADVAGHRGEAPEGCTCDDAGSDDDEVSPDAHGAHSAHGSRR